jgi:hypothetical protein
MYPSAMLTYESKVVITARRDRIWSVIADVERWPDWTPTVSRIEPLDAPALSLGARFRILQPRLRPAIWTVTDVRATQGFVWETRFPGTRIAAEHWIYPSSGVGYDVLLRVSFSGLLGVALGTFTRRLTKSYLAQEATSLKQTIDTGA